MAEIIEFKAPQAEANRKTLESIRSLKGVIASCQEALADESMDQDERCEYMDIRDRAIGTLDNLLGTTMSDNQPATNVTSFETPEMTVQRCDRAIKNGFASIATRHESLLNSATLSPRQRLESQMMLAIATDNDAAAEAAVAKIENLNATGLRVV